MPRVKILVDGYRCDAVRSRMGTARVWKPSGDVSVLQVALLGYRARNGCARPSKGKREAHLDRSLFRCAA